MSNGWVSLDKASKITGIRKETLRKRILRGGDSTQTFARKVMGMYGEEWQINIEELKQLDPPRIKSVMGSAKSGHEILNETAGYLLERVKNLEEENRILSGKLKLLPAPPEEIISQIDRLERDGREAQARGEIISQENKLLQEKTHELEARVNQTEAQLKQQQEKEIEVITTLEALAKEKESIENQKAEIESKHQETMNALEEMKAEKQAQEERDRQLLADLEKELKAREEKLEAEKKKSWWAKLWGK